MTEGAANLYRGTPRTIRRWTEKVLRAGRVPYLQSSPGLGKSTIVKSIAKDTNLAVIDHRLSTSAPEDMSGLPQFVNGMARFAPFEELFPVKSTPKPEGKDGWIIFLDEFNSGSKSVQAASYKLILDRMVGQHDLHEDTLVVLAGNLASDRAITNPISTAMQSRVIHLEMVESHKEWLEDVAIPGKYDERVIGFLNYKPNYLMDFRPDHNEKTFCCPRTWEFMNDLVKNEKKIENEDTGMYAGTITSGVAVEFVQFTKVYLNMITVKEVLADPEMCSVPQDTPLKWAVVSHLAAHITPENFSKISMYVNRFDLSFKILFYRTAMVGHPALWNHPAFAKAMAELGKYLRS